MLISICLGPVDQYNLINKFVINKIWPWGSNTDFITWLVSTLIDGTNKEEKNVANCKTKVCFKI